MKRSIRLTAVICMGFMHSHLLFAQNDALYIDPTGKVGIGTITPKTLLEVNGNISSTGNIGIGTINPINRLQVEGALHMDGHAIYFRQDPTDFNDFVKWSGIPNDRVEIAGWNGVTLGYTNKSGTLTTSLTADGSGNIGIGSAMPRALLDVSGFIEGEKLGTVLGRLGEGNAIDGGTYLGVRGFGTQQSAYGGKSFSIEHSFYGKINSSINFFRGGGTTGGYIIISTGSNNERMIIDERGRVGIGTTSPNAMLEVSGDIGYSTPRYFGFLNPSGGHGQHDGAQIRKVSILATSDICTKDNFIAYSDARIKKNFIISDPVKDLAVLNKLRVTDFKYVDTLEHGNKYKKGLIAQDVEKVFPEAVTRGQDFVPDIFAAPEKTVEKDGVITFFMSKEHHLINGDMVRLITKDGVKEKPVTVNSKKSFSIYDSAGHYNEVFVFGKIVNDFRMVDYDRLYTLNISATQQLSKEIDALKSENDLLKKENSSNHDLLFDMQSRLQSVEHTMEASIKTAQK